MNNKRILLLVALLSIMILLAFLFRSNEQRFDWTESYEQDSKAPYGTFIIAELLQSYFPNQDFTVLNDSIPNLGLDSTQRPSNYIFIGEAIYMDSADVQGLLKFVENGNRAFLSSKIIPYDLMFYLYYEECNDYYWDDYSFYQDSLAHFSLVHPELDSNATFKYQFLERNEVQSYYWNYIDSSYFCEDEYSLTALGYANDDLANFARIKYGKGYFYLHTAPIAFSNFHLLEEAGLEYATKIFSHLEEGPILWDNYSRVSEAVGRRRNQGHFSNPDRRISSKSPLQYILGQPPLTWAWYILLSLGLLYMIFGAKRKQRIIPVLEKNTNTSLEFIGTIGSLYFIQNNHRKLALQKMKLFEAFIREHYHIQTANPDKSFFHRLQLKSEVDEAIIQKIYLLSGNINNSSIVSENTLIEFHKVIDQFYQNCK
jgi:hypothetical protein